MNDELFLCGLVLIVACGDNDDPGPSSVPDVLPVGRFRGTGARATFAGGRYFTVVVDGSNEVCDSLSLTEADTSFDFGGDGTPEDADLSLDLTRD